MRAFDGAGGVRVGVTGFAGVGTPVGGALVEGATIGGVADGVGAAVSGVQATATRSATASLRMRSRLDEGGAERLLELAQRVRVRLLVERGHAVA
jgi:hypothetical protein